MGTDRGEKRAFVSKDTSFVSIEARDDGASDEPNGSKNRDEGAEKTPVVRSLARGIPQKTQTSKLPDPAAVARTPFWSFCAG